VIDEHGLQTLYLTGADTSYAVFKTLQINTIEVKGRIAKVFSPNIVKGYTSNGQEYWICIKSGVSGDEMTMVQALRFLRSR